jgi:hypothetical protein
MLGWLRARNQCLFLQLLPVYSHYKTHRRNECLWQSVGVREFFAPRLSRHSHIVPWTNRHRTNKILSAFTEHQVSSSWWVCTRSTGDYTAWRGGILLERATDCLHRRYCDHSQYGVKGASASETSVTVYQWTRRSVPVDVTLHPQQHNYGCKKWIDLTLYYLSSQSHQYKLILILIIVFPCMLINIQFEVPTSCTSLLLTKVQN